MTWVIAHRGASADEKENTLPAFERAVAVGADLRPSLRTVQHVGYGTSIRAAGSFAWAAGFDDSRVTERGLAKAHRLGLKALVYTVNEPSRLLELQEIGVDGVFTDRPGLARETLAPRPG